MTETPEEIALRILGARILTESEIPEPLVNVHPLATPTARAELLGRLYETTSNL